MLNPFNITKAVDYSDREINELWVDLPYVGFSDIVKPTSPMPMLILGGKGSGKTHIMRYFSYNLQKIRYSSNAKESIEKDGYLGIYMRCGGLNARRFTKKGLSDEQWQEIFSYYMELWLAQLILNVLHDMPFSDEEKALEFEIVKNILSLFDKPIDAEINSLSQIKEFIQNLQKELDYFVNNLSLQRNSSNLKLEIIVSSGNLIFGLPKLLSSYIPYLKDVLFLYLLDEFENLVEYQQQYINTLIREKEHPATFKIGTRLYGIKTFRTFSGGEDIKEGSEYEMFNIDDVLRNNRGYESYVIEICKRRLEISGFPLRNKNLDEYFQEFSLLNLSKTLRDKSRRNYFETLKSKLRLAKFSNEAIETIVNNLTFDKDFVIERTNVFILYRIWKDKGREYLHTESNNIKESAIHYFEDNTAKSVHSIILEKFKSDIIDQICRENHIMMPYYGLDNFVKMSFGIPRILLKILKEVYKQASFNGENPFKDGKISAKAQLKGLELSSKWFIEDAANSDSKKAELALKRIGRFLQELRFSDTPPECSINIFSLNIAHLDDTSKQVITILRNYSYIIRVDERREKNGNGLAETYQINGILASLWELSLSKRGVISLNRSETESIFGNQEEMFEDLLKRKMKKYNAPFSNLDSSGHSLPLF